MLGRSLKIPYKGYIFKSRLEYRWAVFFDAIGLSWFYEYEGFDLGKGLWYLPDFYIPKWDCYFEAKDPSLWPENNNFLIERWEEFKTVIKKSTMLHILTKKRCILSFGGFTKDNFCRTMIWLSGFNILSPNIIQGLAVFGCCKGIDVLYIEYPGVDEDIRSMYENTISPQATNYKELKSQLDYATHKRSYLVPLDISIGFNFSKIRDDTDNIRLFVPYSHYLFCNVNANEITGYKPYTDAYVKAKNAKYGDGSVKVNRK